MYHILRSKVDAKPSSSQNHNIESIASKRPQYPNNYWCPRSSAIKGTRGAFLSRTMHENRCCCCFMMTALFQYFGIVVLMCQDNEGCYCRRETKWQHLQRGPDHHYDRTARLNSCAILHDMYIVGGHLVGATCPNGLFSPFIVAFLMS